MNTMYYVILITILLTHIEGVKVDTFAVTTVAGPTLLIANTVTSHLLH